MLNPVIALLKSIHNTQTNKLNKITRGRG